MSKPEDYTVGWICAIKVEYVAAQVFLDEEHKKAEYVSQHDNNCYTLGRIGKHNVVIATLPFGEYGTTSAATVARDMVHSFPNIRIGLMVGIGGGAPSENHDIRLGDIVVSAPSKGNSGLFQYDFGKNIQGQPYQTTGALNRPPTALLTALAGLQSQYEIYGHTLEKAVNEILEKNKKLKRHYKRPDSSSDRLYRSEVVHPDTKQSCTAVCDPSNLVQRPERAEDEDNPAIHYGLIASANQLMKNALLRDSFAAEKDVLCFEMEAAGLMNHFPCLVIRGICDYSDSHKNKEWQGYAAMIAAAYARDLLHQIPLYKVQAEKKLSDVLSGLHEAIEQHSDSLQKNLQAQEALAQKKLSDEEQKERQECHQLFRLTSSDKDTTYEWYKDRVEHRVEDTCMWFLNHDHFKKWLNQDSGPLLVTADPGCGKSVLAKYLIDDILPQSATTVCYFFFKDQDQNTMRQALCALLHQLFSKRPSLVKHAIEEYRSDGKGLINNTRSLWKIFHNAINDLRNSESIIIALDALDECAESEYEDLVWNIKRQFSGGQMGSSGLKYLLTCRPYEQIVSNFRSLLSTFPYIRIPGEEESDAISREVDLVITYQVDLLAKEKQLSVHIQNDLHTRLQQAINRTYLWIYLIFDYLKKENFKKTQKAITAIIMTLPRTINEAYNQILNKSKNDFVTRKALSIILAAVRPLTVAEMNVAVNIDFKSTIDLDLEDNKAFETRLRSCCGLFISIYQGKIYFLHQTAREFLIDTALSTTTPKTLLWQHSITIHSSHALLGKACVLFLNLFNHDVDLSPDTKKYLKSISLHDQSFLDYSVQFWNTHFHDANIVDANDAIIPFALKICDPFSNSYFEWFHIYLQTNGKAGWGSLMITDLMVAAFLGHTALVTLLLEQGADIEATDIMLYGWIYSNGDRAFVKLLPGKGADHVEYYGRTPLIWASLNGHEAVVKLLLDKGADIEAKDIYYRTALMNAVAQGNEAIVKLLLRKGADTEARDENALTSLSIAVFQERESIVKLLLEKGANTEVKHQYGRTPLMAAVSWGKEGIITLLLKNGANIEAKDDSSQTPLMAAVFGGKEGIITLLLKNGADIEAKNDRGQTPLMAAVFEGKKGIITLLLKNGANIEANNVFGQTPLTAAVLIGKEDIVMLLLEKGADAEVKNCVGRTVFSIAEESSHHAIAKLLKRDYPV